jgi:hypothetical protein
MARAANAFAGTIIQSNRHKTAAIGVWEHLLASWWCIRLYGHIKSNRMVRVDRDTIEINGVSAKLVKTKTIPRQVN